MKRVAVIGGGVTGLGAAHALARLAPSIKTTLFEAQAQLGGHAHTVDITLNNAQGQAITHGVDTGFLVFNQRTYPRLCAWFDELGIDVADSDMSFSVQAPEGGPGGGRLEWSGSDLNALLAQRRNALSPRFWRMVLDILRFNALATKMALNQDAPHLTVGEFLAREGFGPALRDGYLMPMVACIWSCPTEQMLQFPIKSLVQFCHNHGLIQIRNRPQWRTVRGGSRNYVQAVAAQLADVRTSSPVASVQRLSDGVVVTTAQGPESFDAVIFATHSDQTLRLLGADARGDEGDVLGAIAYHRNHAVLHTDASLLPEQRRAWAAWNYERAATSAGEQAGVCLHYWINQLQPLPWEQPVIVSLNPTRPPAPHTVLGRFDYEHPVFDAAAVAAQARVQDLQGRRHTWFAGAWCGHGFHEDGLASGQTAAQSVVRHLNAVQAVDRRAA